MAIRRSGNMRPARGGFSYWPAAGGRATASWRCPASSCRCWAGFLTRPQALRLPFRTYAVGDVVELPRRPADTLAEVRRPDGDTRQLAAGQYRFTATDLPGVYQVRYPDAEFSFVVNVAPRRATSCLWRRSVWNNWACGWVAALKSSQVAAARRQMRDRELEGRQKVWQWLIAAALILLVAEGWWAGRQGPLIMKSAPDHDHP